MSKDEVEKNLEEKVLFINRCAKVLKGGRKFSFSALILAGDCNGRVGYGFAKANELTDAIKKASSQAKDNLIIFEMENTTIPHETLVTWDGAKVLLKPASEGAGIVAGSKIRAVLELAGIKDVVGKNLGSSNPLNQVKATFEALKSLRSRKNVNKLRGIE